MKYLYTIFILIFGSSAFAQIEQNVNTTTGTASNPISEIDSIRFNGSATEMQIILNSGTEVIHNIDEIVNVTFSGQALGQIDALDCTNAATTGTLVGGIAASGVTADIPYTGGNGGAYNTQAIASTGVAGITAELAAGIFVAGAGTLTYEITGTPEAAGTASFALEIGGETCTLELTVHTSEVLPSCGEEVTGTFLCTEITTPAWQTTACEAVQDYYLFGRGLATNGKHLAVRYVHPNNQQESVAIYIENEDLQWVQIEPTTEYSLSFSIVDFGYGNSIAFSGDFMFVGSRTASTSGRVFVFQKDASGNFTSEPTQILQGNPTNNGSQFGFSVDAMGDYLIVGSPTKRGTHHNISAGNQPSAGAAYIFHFNGEIWVQEKHWENPYNFSQIEGSSNYNFNTELMGFSVAIDIDQNGVVTAFAGGPENSQFNEVICNYISMLGPSIGYCPYGAVHILEKNGDTWPENSATQSIHSSVMQQQADFGFDIKAREGVLAVSSMRANSSSNQPNVGSVEIFTKQNDTWVDNDPVMLYAPNMGPEFRFGSSMDLKKSPEGTYFLAIGSVRESSGSLTNPDDNSALLAGSAYIFESSDNGQSWSQTAYLKNPNVGIGQEFGGFGIKFDPCATTCTTSAIKDGQGKVITYRRTADGTWTTDY